MTAQMPSGAALPDDRARPAGDDSVERAQDVGEELARAGIGRRNLLRAAAVLGAAGAGSSLLGAGPAEAHTEEPGYGPILQPGCGTVRGHYLRSTVDTVRWGELPNRTSTPTLTVASGDVVTIDTVSHEGILDDQGQNPVTYFGDHGVARSRVLFDAIAIAAGKKQTGPGPHIVTGPVAVRGAVPGDVLKIEVLRLAPRVPYGVISNRHGKGALPGEYPEKFENDPASKPYSNTGGNISVFTPVERRNGDYRGILPGPGVASFRLTPFLGMMGVALDRADQVDSVPPTIGGGNIDIRDLGVGATFYLPIQVPGAKFYVGDPHFAQGDGEVSLTALEASLRATVRLTRIPAGGNAPKVAFSYPFAENDRYWLPIGLSDPNGKVGGAPNSSDSVSLDTAMKIAVRNALAFLTEERGLAGPVAYAYLSAATDFTVSQVVDITTGVHGRIKKTDFGM